MAKSAKSESGTKERDGELKRVRAGYFIGVGLVAFGLILGFYFIGPCFTPSSGGGEVCLFAGGLIGSTESFLLSWGLVILGIAFLIVNLLMGHTTKGGIAS